MADVPAPLTPRQINRVRKDKRLLLKAREHLLKRVITDIDHWYDLMKTHAILGERQQDPAIRMTMKLIDKILAEQRENEDVVPAVAAAPVIVQVNVGSDRGTAHSRATALQHQQDQRITLTVNEEQPGTDADDSLQGEPVSGAVPQEPV